MELAAGAAWPDTGLFFVRRNGQAWHPSSVSQRFRRLATRGGFPPIRLHDLRHGAATIALEAGIDIKVVSEQNSATPPPPSPATPTKASPRSCTTKPPEPSPNASKPNAATPPDRGKAQPSPT
jgi:hypothetical protein